MRSNATRRVYLTHTRLADRYVIRACIGAWTTEARHVDALWGSSTGSRRGPGRVHRAAGRRR